MKVAPEQAVLNALSKSNSCDAPKWVEAKVEHTWMGMIVPSRTSFHLSPFWILCQNQTLVMHPNELKPNLSGWHNCIALEAWTPSQI
jgi:hypothetical protein